jgi:hypothetical protein
MKASAKKLESKKSDTTGTTGMTKDDSLTCHNCGQMGHISHNCPNCDLLKMLLNQVLVSKDILTAKSVHPHRDKEKGGLLSS